MSTLTRLTRCYFSAISALALLICCVPAFGQSPLATANTIGIFRGANNGQWIVNASGTHSYQGGTNDLGDANDPVFYFGLNGDQPVVGNWTGNNLAVGTFRNGYWYVDANNNQIWDGGDMVAAFGEPGDIPVLGDWNQDGTLHIGVVRLVNNGTLALWYVQTGCASGAAICDYDPDYMAVFNWGFPGDVPVVGDWGHTGYLGVGVVRAEQWIVNTNTPNNNGDCASTDSGSYSQNILNVEGCDGYSVGAQGTLSFEAAGTPVVGEWGGFGGSGYLGWGAFNQGQWLVAAHSGIESWNYGGNPGDVPVVGPWQNLVLGPPPPTTPNAISISVGGNNMGSAGEAQPGVMASFALTYYDATLGAGGLVSGQVVMYDASSVEHCILEWWRSGSTLLQLDYGSTDSLGTSLSDGFCTVSLVSVTNSPTDPTAVTVTIDYTFSGSATPGTYSIVSQVDDVTGFVTAWGQVGTWTVDLPHFTFAFPSLSLVAGALVPVGVSVTAGASAVSGTVTLTGGGLPAGLTFFAFPSTLTLGASSSAGVEMEVHCAASVTPGAYLGTLTLTIGSMSQTIAASITVTAATQIVASGASSSAYAYANGVQTAAYLYAIMNSDGGPGNSSSLTGCALMPSGVTAFVNNSIYAGTPYFTISYTAAPTAQPGQYTVSCTYLSRTIMGDTIQVYDATPTFTMSPNPIGESPVSQSVAFAGYGFGVSPPMLTISPSLPYTILPGNSPTYFVAQILAPAAGQFFVSVTSNGNSGLGFQAGGSPSSAPQSGSQVLTVAAPPTISGIAGIWYLGSAAVNDNCVPGSSNPSQACYYNAAVLTATPGQGDAVPSAGAPANWYLSDSVTGQAAPYVSATCANAACSQVTITAISYASGCGHVNVLVGLGGVFSSVYPFTVDYPATASATFVQDLQFVNSNFPTSVGYLSNITLALVSACTAPMPGIDVHEEFPGGFQACGGSTGWSGGVAALGSWTTLSGVGLVGVFGDQISIADPPGADSPNPQCPGFPVTGQCVEDPVPPAQLSPQANAFASQFIFVGSKNVVTLGKYFPAAPNMQVRYTDHGRDEVGTWQCTAP